MLNNDPMHIHVLEFGPSYDVRNGAEKQLLSPAIGLIARGSGGPIGTSDHLGLLCLAYETEGP